MDATVKLKPAFDKRISCIGQNWLGEILNRLDLQLWMAFIRLTALIKQIIWFGSARTSVAPY
jgi:hypothetical protein